MVFARAKVNLALEVGEREPDGFHQIATVFQAIDMCDVLHLESAAEVRVVCRHPGVPEGPGNLVRQAAERLREFTGCRAGARIRLEKGIPPAAGLGGGSSDAAAALLGLCWLWDLTLSAEELRGLAAELGSDVPFFLEGGTALGEGRGERCRALPPLPECFLVVVCPPHSLSTAQVYALWDLTPPPRKEPGRGVGAVVSALARGDLSALATGLCNDLTPIGVRLVPEVATALRGLREAGALGAEMSGSGPAVFGIFASRSQARAAVESARREGRKAFLCRPVRRWGRARLEEEVRG